MHTTIKRPQSSILRRELEETLREVDAALRAMGGGDHESYAALWDDDPDVTLFGAWGPIERGPEAVKSTFEWVGSRFSDGELVPDNVVIHMSGALACTIGFERGDVSIDGGPPQADDPAHDPRLPLHAAKWHLVHRHADFPPADQRPEGAGGAEDDGERRRLGRADRRDSRADRSRRARPLRTDAADRPAAGPRGHAGRRRGGRVERVGTRGGQHDRVAAVGARHALQPGVVVALRARAGAVVQPDRHAGQRRRAHDAAAGHDLLGQRPGEGQRLAGARRALVGDRELRGERALRAAERERRREHEAARDVREAVAAGLLAALGLDVERGVRARLGERRREGAEGPYLLGLAARPRMRTNVFVGWTPTRTV